MNIVRGLVLLSALWCNQLWCNDDIEQPLATNTMLIFLDDTEQKFGPITSALFAALHQKAAPILASGSLLHFLGTMPTLDDLINDKKTTEEQRAAYVTVKEYYEALDKQIKEFPAEDLGHNLSAQKQLLDELNYDKAALVMALVQVRGLELYEASQQHDAILRIVLKNLSMLPHYAKALSSFNPQEWLIKKVNSDLLLLIPLDYIEAMKKKHAPSFKPTSMTETEYVLGLPVDHMETVVLVDYVKGYKPSSMASSGFMKSLDTIFIPRQQYVKEKKLLKQVPADFFTPSWAIFIDGHGSMKKEGKGKEDTGSVAGLSIKDFQTFLEFLETQVKTKLLIYSACYASGVNASVLYTEVNRGIFKSYPFAIVAEGLNDLTIKKNPMTLSVRRFLKPESIDFEKRKIRLAMALDFAAFERNITSPGMSYTHIIAPVLASMRQSTGLIGTSDFLVEDIQSTPQIKLPGIPWFNVIDLDKKFVSIGKVLAVARTEDLDVVKFFKVQPQGILLYTNYIPFKLIIRGTPMPFLISMAPGNMFEMAGIEVDVSLEEFLKSFDVIKTAPAMLFWIDSLVVNAQSADKKSYSNFCILFVGGKMSLYTFNNVKGVISGDRMDEFEGNFVWTTMSPDNAQSEYHKFQSKLQGGKFLNLARAERENMLTLQQALQKRLPKAERARVECKRQQERKVEAKA